MFSNANPTIYRILVAGIDPSVRDKIENGKKIDNWEDRYQSGKTSLMLRFVDNEFTTSFLSTIGRDMLVKKINDSTKVVIYEESNKPDSGSDFDSMKKTVVGIIYVIAMDASEEIIKNLEKNINELLNWQHNSPQLIIAVTKADLASRPEEVKQFVSMIREKTNNKYNIVETSAKDDINVNTVFNNLIELINKQRLEEKIEIRENLPKKRDKSCLIL